METECASHLPNICFPSFLPVYQGQHVPSSKTKKRERKKKKALHSPASLHRSGHISKLGQEGESEVIQCISWERSSKMKDDNRQHCFLHPSRSSCSPFSYLELGGEDHRSHSSPLVIMRPLCGWKARWHSIKVG